MSSKIVDFEDYVNKRSKKDKKPKILNKELENILIKFLRAQSQKEK